MKTSFSGEDFAKTLAEGSLKEPVILIGIVKPSEDLKVIQFSLGTSCQQWVSIPVEMVDTVEWLGKISCHDHTYDYVHLFLNDEVGPLAEALVALLRSHVGTFARHLRGQRIPLEMAPGPQCLITLDGATLLAGSVPESTCLNLYKYYQKRYQGIGTVCCKLCPTLE